MNNMNDYKHFKFKSDKSLMKMTKVELINYINILRHNWFSTAARCEIQHEILKRYEGNNV